MSDDGDLAARLRAGFDRGFAAPARPDVAHGEALLAIRIAGDRYALRIAELAGVVAGRRVIPLPTSAPELLGLAGLRGALVAVYSLRILLGYPAGDVPRWLVRLGADPSLGLAIDEVEGNLRVLPAQLATADGQGGHVRTAVCADDGPRAVIELTSILATIRDRARSATRSPQER